MNKTPNLREEVREFLNYLAENYGAEDVLKRSILIEKFSKEKFERIMDFCLSEKLARYNPIGKDKDYPLKVEVEGLEWLRDYDNKSRMEESNRLTLFLSTMLVLTAIASFLKDITSINPILFSIIYLVFAILSIIYFKYAKSITI